MQCLAALVVSLEGVNHHELTLASSSQQLRLGSLARFKRSHHSAAPFHHELVPKAGA